MSEGFNPFEPPKADGPREKRQHRVEEGADYFVDATKKTRFANNVVDWVFQYLLTAVLFRTDDIVLPLVGTFAYYLLFETIFGKTPAKWLTRTRVITTTGSRPTFTKILIRSATRFVPFEALSFLGRGRGWHDAWSDTRVVRDAGAKRQRRRRRSRED